MKYLWVLDENDQFKKVTDTTENILHLFTRVSFMEERKSNEYRRWRRLYRH